jgi:hypothetical protein
MDLTKVNARSNQMARTLIIPLWVYVVLCASGCGAAYHRDKYWDQNFTKAPGYEGYVATQVVGTSASTPGPWVTAYNTAVSSAGITEDVKKSSRNRVINGYLLLADTAYSKFAGGYNEQIAYFQITSDLVILD